MSPIPDTPGRGTNTTRRPVRVVRILALIIEEPRVWNRAARAAHCVVSQRQIDLDLRLLRAAGTDVRRARTGYWVSR